MYQISYKDIATIEYEDAINWYALRSKVASEKFIKAVNEKLDSISRNPQRYKNLYKNYYEVTTRKYPYCIVYLVEESIREIIIVAIYHHKRNPKQKYRK